MVRQMRYGTVLVAISVFAALPTMAFGAQKTAPVSRPAPAAFLPEAGVPGGPFLFERGTPRPTHMDVFNGRPVVKSPDGALAVTVTGPKKSYEAWVTIDPSAFPGGPVQVWPMQASVAVLWSPNSQVFALTDNRYANSSYVLVLGTSFRMGESEPGLGVAMIDLSGVVGKVFLERARQYYAGHNYDVDNSYLEALRWVGNDRLLIGVSAMTSGPSRFPNRGFREWNVAYLVDVPHKAVLREVSESALLSQYGIKVYDK